MRPNFFDLEPYRWRGTYPPKDECSGCRMLAELLVAAFHLLRLWAKRVRERDELARLDHRMLRDIGITPTDIDREYRKPFWRA
jgi:uncharacterized protein YjiS (DUF1127 family)